jgi:hypothetical protein
MRRLFLALAALLALCSAARAQQAPNCPSIPYTFVYGTTIDPTQVNANFNSLFTCLLGIPAIPTVATNAALMNTAVNSNFGYVWRWDYAAGNGAPPQLFSASSSACTLNAGLGDGGTQVPSLDGKCWLASAVTILNALEFGVAASAADNTAAMQNAINACGTINGGTGCTLTLPGGTYQFTGANPCGTGGSYVDASASICIYAKNGILLTTAPAPPNAPTTATLNFNNGAADGIAVIGTSPSATIQGFTINNLSISSATTKTGGNTINLQNVSNAYITRLVTSNDYQSLLVGPSNFTTVTYSRFNVYASSTGAYAVKLYGPPTGQTNAGKVTAFTMVGSLIQGNFFPGAALIEDGNVGTVNLHDGNSFLDAYNCVLLLNSLESTSTTAVPRQNIWQNLQCDGIGRAVGGIPGDSVVVGAGYDLKISDSVIDEGGNAGGFGVNGGHALVILPDLLGVPVRRVAITSSEIEAAGGSCIFANAADIYMSNNNVWGCSDQTVNYAPGIEFGPNSIDTHFRGGGSGNEPGSQIGASFASYGYAIDGYPQSTITGAVYGGQVTVGPGYPSGGEVTFTTSANSGIGIGSSFSVSGITPSGYNQAAYTAIAGTTGTTVVGVSSAISSTPGGYVSGGLIAAAEPFGLTVNAPALFNRTGDYCIGSYWSGTTLSGCNQFFINLTPSANTGTVYVAGNWGGNGVSVNWYPGYGGNVYYQPGLWPGNASAEEPAATNILTVSTDMSNAAWTKLNTTVTVDSGGPLSPDGTADWNLLTATNVSNGVDESKTISADTTYWTSFVYFSPQSTSTYAELKQIFAGGAGFTTRMNFVPQTCQQIGPNPPLSGVVMIPVYPGGPPAYCMAWEMSQNDGTETSIETDVVAYGAGGTLPSPNPALIAWHPNTTNQNGISSDIPNATASALTRAAGISGYNVNAWGDYYAGGTAGITQTCTISTGGTLVFTDGIITAGTCNH